MAYEAMKCAVCGGSFWPKGAWQHVECGSSGQEGLAKKLLEFAEQDAKAK